MENNSQLSPDLQSILATLAQSANQPTQQTLEKPAATNIPTASGRPYTPQGQPLSRPPLAPKSVDPRLKVQPPAVTASPKPIDPASITTWQDGLRCVTKIAAQNATFAPSLRRMMQDQRAHEMRWYSERQTLKNVQAQRSSSAAKAQSILQSLGNSFASVNTSTGSEVDNDDELAQFDQKVYTAQRAMQTAMELELKGLGVPFFGTDPKLVVPDEYDMSTVNLSDDQAKWSPVVTHSQLLVLRRKMVSHLEDLYRD